MALTPEQIAEMRAKYNVPSTGYSDVPANERINSLRSMREEKLSQSLKGRSQLRGEQGRAFVADLFGDVRETLSRGKEQIQMGGEKAARTYRELEEQGATGVEKRFAAGGEIAKGTARAIGEGFIGAAKAVLTPEQEKAAKQKFASGVQEGVGGLTRFGEMITPENVRENIGRGALDLWQRYQNLEETNPRAKAAIDATLGYGELALEIEGLGRGGRVLKEGAEQFGEQAFRRGAQVTEEVVPPAVQRLKQAQINRTFSESVRGKAETFARNRIKNEADNFLNSTASLSRRTKEALDQGIDYKEIISDPTVFRGLKVDNGKVVPDEAIEVLQTRIDALYDAKQAMLPRINDIVPKIPRSTIRERAIADQVVSELPPADRDALIDAIDKQLMSLPEQMSVSEVDQFRAQVRRAARDARGIQKDANPYAALENASRNIVFDITDNLPISGSERFKALNDYMRQLINTNEFLDKRVRGATVKGGRLGRYTAQILGGMIGTQGGVFTTVLGAELGGLVSDILISNQLGSSAKMMLIKEITQDPKVLDLAESLLNDILGQTQKMLPAGSTEFRRQIPSQGTQELPARTQSTIDAAEQSRRGTGGTPPAEAFGAVAGFETDEEGNLQYNPIKGALGTGVVAFAKRVPGAGEAVREGIDRYTTKLLKKLEGKTTVSKQFISDFTNSPDLKQAERDLFRRVLEGEGDKINVPEFTKKVKSQLLPLEAVDTGGTGAKGISFVEDDGVTRGDLLKYENITLPEELRGPVAEYDEVVYNSPIKTSGGQVHGFETDNYFAHVRVEDLPATGMDTGRMGELRTKSLNQTLTDAEAEEFYRLKDVDDASGGTRRIIEIQSDLFQKGRLGQELDKPNYILSSTEKSELDNLTRKQFNQRLTDTESKRIAELQSKGASIRESELAKLEPYRNTWWERITREEVQRALQDGKTKLQFPTGETAMKIEGLGDNSVFNFGNELLTAQDLRSSNIVGQTIRRNNLDEWIITEVLEDGKFKAVPKDKLPSGYGQYGEFSDKQMRQNIPESFVETFDISGKVDTNNPIYKFYEKDIGRYLKNKYGAKMVTDDQGVNWWEVDLNKIEPGPIEAFGVGAGLLGGNELMNED